MKTDEGYLIVLKTPEVPLRKNRNYKGVDRVPSYRFENQQPIEQEIEAMDCYILGDIRDEWGLIESHEVAVRLLDKFSNSPREFELIRCRRLPNDKEKGKSAPPNSGGFIGVDIAGLGGDYWSIVGDFPEDNRFATDFAKLNDFGLFTSTSDAMDYLDKYRLLKLPDFDSPFEIVEVSRI